MNKEEQIILQNYQELTEKDYIEQYQYLNDNCKIVSIDYEECIKKIKRDTFILYVGGAWCPNCQAIISFINDAAIKTNQTIYNFDTRIGQDKVFDADIRNCTTKATTSLYDRFIKACEFKSDNFTEGTNIYRMSVPTILVYNNGKLVDFISEEYLYDGTILFKKEDYEKENKTDYSQEFYNRLINLFEKC